MLDIAFIRQHADLVKDAARKKHMTVDVDALLVLDEKRVALQQEIDMLRQKQNTVSKEIPNITDDAQKQELLGQMKVVKQSLQEKEAQAKKVKEEWQILMYQIPNIPDLSVPEGKSDADNVEIRTWGNRPEFAFEPRDHVEIMKDLNMVDFERGVKVHGFRGYFLMGAGARLAYALWHYAQEFFSERGFTPVLAPSIARPEHFYGTGHLPNEAEDIFVTQDGDYLTGTSEVSVMGFHADEILDHSELPKKFIAFSSCYRREAGSHGKDTKGLIRVHEFQKVEQVILCKASHEESVKWHEEITQNSEAFMQSLGLHYHVVLNCGGDIGQGQVKKYDIEAWVPSQDTFRETHSSSYFHDFQTRRFNIRYRDKEGQVRFAHSLNNTAIATPRVLVPIVEQYQQNDGSVRVPEVLQKYVGIDVIKKKEE